VFVEDTGSGVKFLLDCTAKFFASWDFFLGGASSRFEDASVGPCWGDDAKTDGPERIILRAYQLKLVAVVDSRSYGQLTSALGETTTGHIATWRARVMKWFYVWTFFEYHNFDISAL